MSTVQDSTDVTLACNDDEGIAAHKVMLAQIDQSCKWASGQDQKLPYYLNEGKIDDKIRRNATIPEPFRHEMKAHGTCLSIQCSTGFYYAVWAPLIKQWMGMAGKSAAWMDGLQLQVESVIGHLDKAGAAQSYKVRLWVEGEAITIHFHNTTHKIIAQGNHMVQIFSDKIFIPYFERETDAKGLKIKEINEQMCLGRRGEKRTMNPASSAKSRPQAKKMTTREEMPKHVEYDLAEITLDESCIELDDTIEEDLVPASTALPVSIAASILEEVLGMSGIPNTSQDISLTNPGLPALGNKLAPNPALDSLPSRGMEGQTTSTPNPSPQPSPARNSIIMRARGPPPLPLSQSAPFLPFTLCSEQRAAGHRSSSLLRRP